MLLFQAVLRNQHLLVDEHTKGRSLLLIALYGQPIGCGGHKQFWVGKKLNVAAGLSIALLVKHNAGL